MVSNDGAEDADIYDDEGREHLVDDDELSPEEEAFMEGYDEEDSEEPDEPSVGDEAYEEAFED